MPTIDKELEKILELADTLDRGRVSTEDFAELASVLVSYLIQIRDINAEEAERRSELVESAKKDLTALVESQQRRIDEKLATVKDGRDGINGKDGRDGERGADGKDADPEEVALLVLSLLDLKDPKDWTGDIQELKEEIKELTDAVNKIKKTKVGLMGGTGLFGGSLHYPRHQAFTMNGSDTSVTLTDGSVGANGTALIVRYQGQTLDLTTHYTVDGSKITFVGFTPESDTIISVTYWS